MERYTVSVFGADPSVKVRFEESVAKPGDAHTVPASHRLKAYYSASHPIFGWLSRRNSSSAKLRAS